MEALKMQFDGRLLRRGFWIYIWDIRSDTHRHLYVGRTGDSSSPNASSPFARIGQHLDSRLNAKGNSMAKRLKAEGLNAFNCMFEMVAFGPLFEEQKDFTTHCPLRDQTAALERAVADHLRGKGYRVLGDHPKHAAVDTYVWEELRQEVDKIFPISAQEAQL